MISDKHDEVNPRRWLTSNGRKDLDCSSMVAWSWWWNVGAGLSRVVQKMVLATESLSLIVCIVIAVLLFDGMNVVSSTESKESRIRKQHALFVFGDSIFDPGNNNLLNISIKYKADFQPYGESYFKRPTGRFSDGRLVPDFIALKLNLSLWKPYLDSGKHQFLNGANFASAGSGVLPTTDPGTLNLGVQLSFFKNVTRLLRQEVGDKEAKIILSNAVYLFNTGGGDYWSYNDTEYPDQSTKEEFVKFVIGNLTHVVKEIYKLGGRRFAFQNVAPLGCLPGARQYYNLTGTQCEEAKSAFAKSHNRALSNVCKELALERQLSGFKYLIFDFYTTLLDRYKNFQKYGFKEAYVACCGGGIYHASHCGMLGEYVLCKDPREYLFFDGWHPSEHAYAQLAELLWSGSTNVTWPLNLKQLFELEPEIHSFLKDDALFSDE